MLQTRPKSTCLLSLVALGFLACQATAEQVVFLAGGMSDEDKILFTTALTASRHPGVVLFDTPTSRPHTRAFVQAFRPEQSIWVGVHAEEAAALQQHFQGLPFPPLCWTSSNLLYQTLFPQAKRVVVCPAEPRRILLQAACLAGVLRAPLVVTHGQPDEAARLQRLVRDWNSQEIHAVGSTYRLCGDLGQVRVLRLLDEEAVTAAYLRHQLRKGPIKTLVVANPADTREGLGGMSSLAPWLALQRRAVLLLTNDAGTNVESVVNTALKHEGLLRADFLILAANLKAIPMERRPNPIPGKDEFIETEPLTPTGTEPFSFAIGRLFHEDHNIVALMLARQRLLEARPTNSPKVLLVSNPGGGLPLLETFSRNTAQELSNAGYDVTALFGKESSPEAVRRLLPEQTLFLWEGHHSTLIRDYGVHDWPEPLRPSLIFLQSCLALTEAKAQPFLQRGAVGVIGSSSRTYSGSGGAFALAFCDALVYEQQSLGGSLRQAKNFMLAFALLKEKRLGEQAKLTGANVRAGWAFSLWGDPTVKLPRPVRPSEALENVRHQVRGNTIVVSFPGEKHDAVVTARYKTEIKPNVRLAGLRSKEKEDEVYPLIPFVFVEVRLPRVPAGKTPVLNSRLPDDNWVFCWDQRRSCGYLLVRPRTRDREEIRFHVSW